jgi:putative alpha-1,2-mannosidase
LYPVAGSDQYRLGAPLFGRAEVKMQGNRLLVIAENHAPDHPYVEKVWLNDTPLDRTWVRHAEIAQGGVVRFSMSTGPRTPRQGERTR